MGCVGMSMDDFCRCTPSEFQEVFEAWNTLRENQEHTAWERVRMQCLCSLQPYSKKQLSASDIMEFPWEKKAQPSERSAESTEDIKARYEAVKKRMGLV